MFPARDRVARSGAKHVRMFGIGGRRKGRGVEPLLQRARASAERNPGTRSGRSVPAVPRATSADGRLITRRERRAGGKGKTAGDGETLQNMRTSAAGHPELVLSEGQLIEISPADLVALVEAGVTLLGLEVLPVLRHHRRCSAHRAGVVDGMRVLIIRAQCNAVGEPLVHPQRPGVEPGEGRRLLVVEDQFVGSCWDCSRARGALVMSRWLPFDPL